LKELPNYNNSAADSTFKKMGPFVYDQDNSEDKNLPNLDFY